jgi:hypothetical protein
VTETACELVLETLTPVVQFTVSLCSVPIAQSGVRNSDPSSLQAG